MASVKRTFVTYMTIQRRMFIAEHVFLHISWVFMSQIRHLFVLRLDTLNRSVVKSNVYNTKCVLLRSPIEAYDYYNNHDYWMK